MRFEQAIKTAKDAAAKAGESIFVVHDPAPGVDDAEAFHSANQPGVEALYPRARWIATVDPDGRVFITNAVQVAA